MQSSKRSAFRGAQFTVAMRWSDRLIGLVSTMRLARVLLPQDFGLVAMATIAVVLVDVVLDLGVAAALVQNSSASDADFDTAWTLRLCQVALVAAIAAAGAPLVASFYNDPRLADVMRVVAVSTLVGGFENIGVVRLQKDMEFGREFAFFASKRLIGTVITIGLALTLRSYWALVIGTLASRLVGVALSYLMHPYRPRFSLSRWSGIWGFSQWNILSSIASYLGGRADQFVIGRRESAKVLGWYSVGSEVAFLPSTELLAPLGRVMFPAFVRVREDVNELLRIFLLSLAVQALVGIPAGIGIALVAEQVVALMLGAKWIGAVPIVQTLGLAGVALALSSSPQYLLLALGRIRTLAWFNAVLCILLVLGLASLELTVVQIAKLRLAVVVLGLLIINWLAISAMSELNGKRVVREVWRPLLAACAMWTFVEATDIFLLGAPIVVVLAIKVLAGALVYLTAVALLWVFAGRPQGGEAYVLEKTGVARLWTRARARV